MSGDRERKMIAGADGKLSGTHAHDGDGSTAHATENLGWAVDGRSRQSPSLQRLVDSMVRVGAQAQIRGDSGIDRSREAARAACEETRRLNLPVERLIVAIKAAWRLIPEAQRLSPTTAGDTLDGLVSFCISEFYSNHRAGDGDAS